MNTGFTCFKVFACSLSSCFVILFGIVIASLGEEGAGLCASRTFVCFVRVSFCHFSLPLGVGCWLQFVIVALPGFFYYLLFLQSLFSDLLLFYVS